MVLNPLTFTLSRSLSMNLVSHLIQLSKSPVLNACKKCAKRHEREMNCNSEGFCCNMVVGGGDKESLETGISSILVFSELFRTGTRLFKVRNKVC